MTKQQVEEMLTILSKEFRIKKPKLSWSKRNAGRAFGRRRVALGHRHGTDIEYVVLHEFAHILTHKLHGPRIHHGPEFMFTLRRVAEAWYGSDQLYPWDKEYKTIQKWWRERQQILDLPNLPTCPTIPSNLSTVSPETSSCD